MDWILLAVFHMKSIKLKLKEALGLMKGVAAYSMRFALTMDRLEHLKKVWEPIRLDLHK